LEQEGIPYAFEPFEPGVDIDVLGRPVSISLAVPSAYAERAADLLAALEAAAPIEMPEGDDTDAPSDSNG
jgi:hypothetical protein